MTTSEIEWTSSWPHTRARFLFREVVERGYDLPLASVTKDGGVEFRDDLDISVWNPTDDVSSYKRVVPGDFVIGLRSFQSGIGFSTISGLVSPAYTVLRPTAPIEHGYYKHLFKSNVFVSRLENVAQGIRQGRTISTESFYNLRLPTPPALAQRAIADFLDAETARIDALIAKKRQLVCLLGVRYREERRVRVLRRLDPITGSGLDIPDWPVAHLGVLIGLQRGHDLPIDQRNDGTVPVISSGGPSGWHDEAAAMGPGVVTGRYGTIGEVYYVDGPYWPLNTTLYVHDFRGYDPRWVYHLLSVLPLDSDSAKSAVTGINRNVIGVLRVPVPPLDEQRRLAKELDAKARQLESLTSRLEAQIKLLAEHRQALVTAAVTGQLEVPGVAASHGSGR